MLRRIHFSGLVLVVWGIWCQPLQAHGFWGWFAELSGPGEFRAQVPVSFTFRCKLGDNRGATTTERWLGLLNQEQTGWCWFVDLRTFRSVDDGQFERVTMKIYEGGRSYRVRPPLEVGFGGGFVHFNSGEGKTINRPTVSGRLIFKPLLAIDSLKGNGKWGFLQYYVRGTWLVGNLERDDFRPKPGNDWPGETNDVKLSYGVLIDLNALFR